MRDFLATLNEQRWDDHRYYHQSRINQTLHFLSAAGFLVAYSMIFSDPAMAAIIGWVWSMGTRQSGHFFFEPQGYDKVNQATNEYKEAIKVGYNLNRKVILISIWLLSPFLLLVSPTLFGLMTPADTIKQTMDQIGMIWLFIAVAGLLFRTMHLFFIRDIKTGLVWMTKILTDPLHDLKMYYKAPFYLMRGQLIDPMDHVVHEKLEVTA
ncbi:hypothetical protein [Fluviibacter phosphoraccumulans]|uniref:Uncharacterized protein n=1 Tax=Fluviibacter phosphoraccumulans TaxID=1751046 RepID=A0A679HXU8_9RHOO|nr:hypothetical protein [Fluviibacter phosphoraccumulans]BBU69848.1 hypothetical protein ICHIAU1_21310 [Fluviibacter phosphoraccumulans]BBU70969.1 hypothetical protein ICHIJ1_08880 [Fluviibacter phosphoraccumulans]BCA65677.1 hypothetical protein SHINM1_012790 [Fluviibacter phosphoraccumulans]